MKTILVAMVLGLFIAVDANSMTYAPKQPGPAIIVISGASGPAHYMGYAKDLSKLGYYVVLIDGNDILTKEGITNLRKAIEQARQSPHVIPGKTAMIGFSRGGGGALAYATEMPDLVSVVVAYYPQTNFVNNAHSFVSRFQVPILVFAGGEDTYNNCCLIETIRSIETAAKESGAQFELIVYPNVGHGFNLTTNKNYSYKESRDTWHRTVEILSLHHPLRKD
jgi:dienelactone hydrolase